MADDDATDGPVAVTPIAAGTRYMVAAGLFLVALVGLAVYMVFAFVVLKSAELRRDSYYMLCVNLAACDVCFLLSMLLHSLPAVITGTLLGGDFSVAVFGFLVQLGWFSTFPSTILLAVERFARLCKPKTLYPAIFAGQKTQYLLAPCWLLGALSAATHFNSCCGWVFDIDRVTWRYENQSVGATIIMDYELALFVITASVSSLLCVAALYNVTWGARAKIAGIGTYDQEEMAAEIKHQRWCLVQFMVVFAVFVIYDISLLSLFAILPDWLYVGVVYSFIYVINCSNKGIVWFVMGKNLRMHL